MAHIKFDATHILVFLNEEKAKHKPVSPGTEGETPEIDGYAYAQPDWYAGPETDGAVMIEAQEFTKDGIPRADPRTPGVRRRRGKQNSLPGPQTPNHYGPNRTRGNHPTTPSLRRPPNMGLRNGRRTPRKDCLTTPFCVLSSRPPGGYFCAITSKLWNKKSQPQPEDSGNIFRQSLPQSAHLLWHGGNATKPATMLW